MGLFGCGWCKDFRSLVDVHVRGLLTLRAQVQDAKILAAKALIAQTAGMGMLDDIRAAEFKVFSQFGEDGIIQYLIRQARIPEQAGRLSSSALSRTRRRIRAFLVINDNWRGLIMDGSASHMRKVRDSSIYWRHNLVAVDAFIDADNINDLIRNAGFSGEIGLLSVDIDGNDYWVWEKIEIVNPILVVAEYNSVFGPTPCGDGALRQEFRPQPRARFAPLLGRFAEGAGGTRQRARVMRSSDRTARATMRSSFAATA